MSTDEDKKILLAAANNAWRKWHDGCEEDEIPTMSLVYERAFTDGVKWLIECDPLNHGIK